MPENNFYRLWPRANDRSFVEEMIRDPGSKHWENLNEFVKQRVRVQAGNIPIDYHEEIIQEIMHKVAGRLPGFQFRSALQGWLIPLITYSIIDVYRKLQKEKQFTVPLEKPSDDDEREDEPFPGIEVKSAEESSLINDDLRDALEALVDYTNAHRNSTRNSLIIRMVILEGYTHEKTAEAVGCKRPVVDYVVREAQRYAREKLGNEP